MRRAIGFLILLGGLNIFFNSSMKATDNTVTAFMQAAESAAQAAEVEFSSQIK